MIWHAANQSYVLWGPATILHGLSPHQVTTDSPSCNQPKSIMRLWSGAEPLLDGTELLLLSGEVLLLPQSRACQSPAASRLAHWPMLLASGPSLP